MRISLLLGLAISLLSAPLALAGEPLNPVDIREWTVPYDASRPRDPFAVSPGEVWFVGQRDSYLAKLDVASGEFSKTDLADEPGPHNLVVSKDGTVWYAGNLSGYIGRFNPRTGSIEKIAMPDKAARDPHTLIFDAGEKHLWFTVQGGNFIGRLTLATRKVDLIRVPSANARPYGIDIAPDGTPWVALFGTSKLASIDPYSLDLREHALPDGARPRRLVAASNGQIYYGDHARGLVGLYHSSTGRVSEWLLPSGARSRPYGMVIDARDRIWLVETGVSPNQLVGFDTADKKLFSVTPIASGAGSVRHMHYLKADNSVWFGTDNNTIGRALVGD